VTAPFVGQKRGQRVSPLPNVTVFPPQLNGSLGVGRKHQQEEIPSQTYYGRLVPSQPNALMSIRKPTLYPLSYGGSCW
jgi:hypothetical protein